jgi:ABC-type transport system substrate-binding protein
MRDMSRRPPPGVGSYRIGRIRPGRRVVLVRNRDFRLPGVPGGLVDALTFRQGESPADEVEAVTNGQLDVMTDVPPHGRLPELRSELSDRYFEAPDLTTRYLFVHADRPPFSDPKLREALALAIDKPEAARLLAGLAHPTCNLLPPSLQPPDESDSCPWGDVEEHPDLVRARELVEESGAQNQRVLVHGSRADRPVTRLYVRTLRTIGLGARIAPGRGADITLATASSPLPDAGRFLVPLARRVPLVADPEAQLLADELAHAGDSDDAARLAAQLDRQLTSDGVVVPYAAPSRTVFLSARIDVDNCLRIHPVYGLDISGLCLR